MCWFSKFSVNFTLFYLSLTFQYLRLQALNQNINFKFEYIRLLKSDIHQLRVRLKSELSPDLYQQLVKAFNDNKTNIKHSAKERLSQKLNWLIYKYFSHECRMVLRKIL